MGGYRKSTGSDGSDGNSFKINGLQLPVLLRVTGVPGGGAHALCGIFTITAKSLLTSLTMRV